MWWRCFTDYNQTKKMCTKKSSQVKWDEVLPTVHAACVHLYHVSPSLTQPGTLPLQMAHWDCHWRSDPGPGWRKQSWWVETFYIIIYKSNFKFMLTLIQPTHQRSTCKRNSDWESFLTKCVIIQEVNCIVHRQYEFLVPDLAKWLPLFLPSHIIDCLLY